MDFNIDDIDLNDIPGYTPITKSTPIWKRDMIEKKNQEKIEEYINQKKKEKEEVEKWKNVPEWKRKLMMEKEKEKAKKSEEELKKDKEAEEARKAKLKEQQEMERRMQEEMQEVPEWKREIMMKRGGAIRNWADEREDENAQENGEGQRADEMDSAGEHKVYTQKATLVLKDSRDSQPSPPPQQSQPSKVFTQKASVKLQDPRAAQTSPTPQQTTPSKTSPQKSPVKDIRSKTKSPVLQQPQTSQPQTPKAPVSQTQQSPAKEEKKPPKRVSLDEAKLEEEWDSLPLWKREILMKRGGAPTNWADEREEVNEQEQ